MRDTKTKTAVFNAARDRKAFDKAAMSVKKARADYKAFCEANGRTARMDRTQVYGYNRSVSGRVVWSTKSQYPNTIKNAAGQSVTIVKHTSLKSMPNSITQIINAKGGIDRNYYGQDGRQIKQITNNDHGQPKTHPYGKNGEHVHD